MSFMDTFTMINTDQLAMLNAFGVVHGYERTLSDALTRRIDPDGLHVVAQNHVLPDGRNVRCLILVKLLDKVQPTVVTLDINLEDFRALPRFTYDTDGSVIHDETVHLNRAARKVAREMAAQVNATWEAA